MSRPAERLRGRAISSPLVEFLQRELAPTPGRLGATTRLTLACTAATVPIMIHHIPHGMVVMIVMYLIAKEDTTATLLGSVLGALGVTVGLALALLAWQVVLETGWLRVVFVFLFAAVGLYIGRTMVFGALGSAFGVPAAMAMVVPDLLPIPNMEYMTESILWLWWCVVLGLAVNLGVQLLLSRRATRWYSSAARSSCGSRPWRVGAVDQSPFRRRAASDSAVPDLAHGRWHLRDVDTSQMASLRHAWARQHRAGSGALISLVDQLVTPRRHLEGPGCIGARGTHAARL
jgi:hypothetical protein